MNMSKKLPVCEQQPRMRRSTFIADSLREMIFSGDLKPGDRLPTEEQLCKHFAVSRTTLRESIQTLRVSGLLEVTPGRGSFVRLPSNNALMQDLALLGRYAAKDEQEILYLQGMLEMEMVRRVCDMTVEKKKELNDHVVSRGATAEEAEEQEFQWHLDIARLACNGLCTVILEALMSMSRTLRRKRFEDPDEVMRTMGVQIRLNATIMEGDKAAAGRMLLSYLGIAEVFPRTTPCHSVKSTQESTESQVQSIGGRVANAW